MRTRSTAQQEADPAAASMAADMAAALAIPRRHRLKLASISTVAVIVLLALVAAVVSFLRPGIGERLLDRDIAITVVFLELWATAYVRARFMSTRFMQAVFQIVLGGSIVLYLLVDPHVRFWH